MLLKASGEKYLVNNIEDSIALHQPSFLVQVFQVSTDFSFCEWFLDTIGHIRNELGLVHHSVILVELPPKTLENVQKFLPTVSV